jgi:predicted PurR-regulated permease PerM
MINQQPSLSTEQPESSTWPDWQKQIVAVLLLLSVPVALYVLRPVLGPLFLTFAIAFVLMYPIRLLQRWVKLSYRLSAFVVYFVFFILSLVMIGWFVGQAVAGIIDTIQSARQFFEQLFANVSGQAEGGVTDLLRLDFLLDGFKALSVVGAGLSLLSSPGDFFAAIIDRISGFTNFVGGYGFVIVLLLFFLLEWPSTLRIIGSRMPAASRREYAILLRRMVNLGERYLIGSLLIVLFYWAVTALLFALSGVPNPIILGLLVAIPNFIPQGGGLVSALMVFVITLVTGSTTFATNRLIFAFIQMTIFMLISGVAYYFVDVRIYSKSVRVPIWIILVGIVVFGALMGVIGLFVAAAVVAILGELLDFVLKKLRGVDPYPGEPEPPLFLKHLSQDGSQDDQASDITNLETNETKGEN